MMQRLFDVTIGTFGDSDSDAFEFDVRITDRRPYFDGRAIDAGSGFAHLVDAIDYARGAVTAFMHGTEA
jgi:hypothetical protein